MNLLCNLAAHAPAPVDLVNQGFAFSRCRRCGSDLIRSASASATRWTRVPPGFRIAWRFADLTAFEYLSDADLALAAARRSASTARDVARMAATLGGWWVVDHARRAGRRMVQVGRSTRQALLRLPGRRQPGSRLVVTFRMTMARSLPHE